MAKRQELALCYTPEAGPKVRKRKGVLVRLGIRIRNVRPEQTGELVGTLAGLEEYRKASKTEETGRQEKAENGRGAAGFGETELHSLTEDDRKASKTKENVCRNLTEGCRDVAREKEKEIMGQDLAGYSRFLPRPDEISELPPQTGGEERGSGMACSAPQIPEEMLVLCNFSGARLDRLLRELRKANASVALKAVLTEINAGWSFYQLYQELRRERDFLT